MSDRLVLSRKQGDASSIRAESKDGCKKKTSIKQGDGALQSMQRAGKTTTTTSAPQLLGKQPFDFRDLQLQAQRTMDSIGQAMRQLLAPFDAMGRQIMSMTSGGKGAPQGAVAGNASSAAQRR